MKQLLLTIIFSTIAICCLAQEVRQVINKDADDNVEEIYYVLKSDKNIKHGKYQRFYARRHQVAEEGFYQNNQRDSVWKKFNYDAQVIDRRSYKNGQKNGEWTCYLMSANGPVVGQQGTFANDQPVGVWTFNTSEGQLNFVYDYSANKLLKGSVDTTETYQLIYNKDTLNVQLDIPPVRFGYPGNFADIVSKEVTIPASYLESLGNATSGTVKMIVQFYIGENGHLSGSSVLRGSCKDCNIEALNAIKRCDDGNWLPGIYKGHSVKVRKILPLSFTMSRTR